MRRHESGILHADIFPEARSFMPICSLDGRSFREDRPAVASILFYIAKSLLLTYQELWTALCCTATITLTSQI